jgi:hypothetical protein
MEFGRPAPERSLMSDAEQLQVEAALRANEFVNDPQHLNNVVACLRTEEALDPLQSVYALAACSPHLQTLFNADIGLLRAARLGEHTEADLSGLEQDYIQLFPDPEHRQILRFASLVQDSGKSLCVKATGDNQQQTRYNQAITEALLDKIDSAVMANDAKDAVRLLVEYDIVGNMLQGRFDQAQVDELRARWPARFANQLADFMVTSYMSDASAHTAHRAFTNADGEQQPCVTPEDVSLDFLFEPQGQSVILAQPYRRAVAALFPDTQATTDLLRPDTPAEAIPTREYPYTTETDGIWSATLAVQGQPYAAVKEQIGAFAMATGFPISAFIKRGRGDIVSEVTIVRDPSRRFGTPSPEEHEPIVEQLTATLGWERQPKTASRPDVSACVGLLEGYDEATGTLHMPVEAVAFLLEHGWDVSWRTEPTTLISARRVTSETGGVELQAWDERVMRITGIRRNTSPTSSANPALDQVKALSGSFNQRRFFAEDGVSDKTIAFAS